MKIEGESAQYYTWVFERALKEGDRYMCLNTGNSDHPFQIETMRFFKDKSEALEYSYIKRVNDYEYLESLPILPVLQQLYRNIELQHISRSPGVQLNDVSIDTRQILSQEWVRREIFIEEIFNQLYERRIKPDMARLIDCIEKDESKFTISGIERKYGIEKRCTIQIEQTENRAFVITTIEPQISQQKIQGLMKSEVLEGTVQKEDALEIKKMLQEEKEKGNRFVSFPADKDDLKKGDFTPFKSAVNAHEHANENAQERHIVRSIPVVGKEIDSLLENKKEQQNNNFLDNEREEKPSRGQELSR